jgi:hypothetical protein
MHGWVPPPPESNRLSLGTHEALSRSRSARSIHRPPPPPPPWMHQTSELDNCFVDGRSVSDCIPPTAKRRGAVLGKKKARYVGYVIFLSVCALFTAGRTGIKWCLTVIILSLSLLCQPHDMIGLPFIEHEKRVAQFDLLPKKQSKPRRENPR